MEAKEEIYQYIKENRKEGVTAQDIAEIFGIKRNVASHYLNCLEKDGKLQKGQTRPVHFSISTNEDDLEKSGYMESDVKETEHNNSVFSGLIGCNGSMEQVIEKCKAAVNYPVNGLTMIICGASGVGKSYLASLIHQYAMEVTSACILFSPLVSRDSYIISDCFQKWGEADAVISSELRELSAYSTILAAIARGGPSAVP